MQCFFCRYYAILQNFRQGASKRYVAYNVESMKKSTKKKIAIKITKNMKIQPLGDRILIKPMSVEEKASPAGILIPDTVSKEKPEQGKVVAVGAGRRDEKGVVHAPQVKIGDTVLFSKYGYDEVKIDGDEYFILKEENILAIIN